MNVSHLISHDAPPSIAAPEDRQNSQQRAHQYPTRQSMSASHQSCSGQHNSSGLTEQDHNGSIQDTATVYEPSAPTLPLPKNVAFELLFDGPNNRARLPMRVQIFPHDTTDSIVTTVKNFYGLYDGAATGVSFEDERGNTLIARYENLRNNMTVYVRVVPDYSQPTLPHAQVGWNSASPTSAGRIPHLEEAFQMPPPQLSHHHAFDQAISRPSSRVARKRDTSPRANRNHRSTSAPKHRSRSGIKSRETSLPRDAEEQYSDALNAYSDSDGGGDSVTSSRKARSELLASAEISVDNIVEGGRRKRAKFESSVSLPGHLCTLDSMANHGLSRNYPYSCHLKCLPPIPFLRSLLRGDQTVKTILPPSPDLHSEHTLTRNPYNPHRAMAMVIIRMV